MNEQQKTGSVTAFGIVSVAFGFLTMIFSFIPCFGSYALFLSILPLIIGCAGYYIAKKSVQPSGLPLAGIIMSLIAFSVAGYQYHSMIRWSSPSQATSILIFIFFVWVIVILLFVFTNLNTISDNKNLSSELLNNIDIPNLFSGKKTQPISISCPTCNNQLNKNDVFCNSCGTNVQSHIQVALLSNCPSCNNSITSNDSFCASCGYNIQQYKQSFATNQIQNVQPILLNDVNRCSSCGSSLDANDSFCENCGNKLK